MKSTWVAAIIASLLALFVFALYSASLNKKSNALYVEGIQYDDAELVVNENVVLDIAFADTRKEITRGLSQQRIIQENQGLLFKFSTPGLHGIWMRGMYFPIDIIWLNENLVVVDVKRNASPDSFRTVRDAEVFTPKVRALYVLEVQAGFTDVHSIDIGDTFSIREND
ncbi:MAG: DUF192 domain-containing protein [Candidatus Paceibacterota bacterium]